MRAATAFAIVLAAFLVTLDVAPASAQDAGVPGAAARPPRRPAQLAPTAPPDVAPIAAPPAQPAPPVAEPPVAESRDDDDDDDDVPPTESRRDRESREDRERWRVPSDLVNPFLDDDDTYQRRERRRRAQRDRDEEGGSWFIAEEDLVDPWRDGRLGPFYSVRCEGRWCRPDPERAVYLEPPGGPAHGHRARARRRVRSVELAALVSASTVSDEARARLEVQATVHRGAFGLGLTLSTSTGDVRVGSRDVTHPRHAIALLLEHRLTDGIISLDLGLAAGLMLMDLEDAELAPVARVMATAGVPIARNVDVLVRADALTTFIRPGGRAVEGPSAFEFAMGVGLRISTQ